MDPIAHTLTGATLAQTRLRQLTPLAATTLMIGANLPDIDAAATLLGPDAALYYRRGWSHGIVALISLPWLLTGVMILFDRFVRLRQAPEKTPVRVKGLLVLSYIGVLSHLFLDWLNTYGIRLLMPFSGEWFYGDTLFIIDPWVWLLMAASVVLVTSFRRRSQIFWIILLLITSLVIMLVPEVPLAAKLIWWLGVAIILSARVRGLPTARNDNMATYCLVAFAIYLIFLGLGSQWTKSHVLHWMENEKGLAVKEIMADPVPANPLYREILIKTKTHYHRYRVPVFRATNFEPVFLPVAIEEPDGIISKALSKKEVQGFVNWMRFPHYEVRKEEMGFWVIIRDLRYVKPDEKMGFGIGMVEVFVSQRPKSTK